MKIVNKVINYSPKTEVIAVYQGKKIWWRNQNTLVDVPRSSIDSVPLENLNKGFFNTYNSIGENPETLHFLLNGVKVTMSELKDIVLDLGIIKEDSK